MTQVNGKKLNMTQVTEKIIKIVPVIEKAAKHDINNCESN